MYNIIDEVIKNIKVVLVLLVYICLYIFWGFELKIMLFIFEKYVIKIFIIKWEIIVV